MTNGHVVLVLVATALFLAQCPVDSSPASSDERLDVEIDPPGTIIIVTPLPDVTTPGPDPTATPTGPTTPTTPTTPSGPTGPTTPAGPTTPTTPQTIPIIQGLGCGSSILLSQGNVVQMSSSNFGVGNYSPKETCNWNIQGNQCRLEATCPCIGIPPSWNCIEGYLKIRTGPVYDLQKFCGGNKPGQPIRSDTSELNVRFRGGYKTTGTGFTCFVSCIGPGQPSPLLPSVTCPSN